MRGRAKVEELPSRFRLHGRLPPWLDNKGPEGDVVISTRIRLARNITGHKFPVRASARDKLKIFKEAATALGGVSRQCGKFEVINFGQLRKLEQHFLVEERMVSMDMLKADGERGVACNQSGKLSVMINEEDHLRIQGMDSGFHTFDLWETTNRADDSIGKGLKYSYCRQLGFLTACPTNSGTGLRISYLMHLPGLVLTKAIDAVLLGASQMGISTRGFFGECSDVVGNFFQLSNQATMGASESEFIESTSKAIKEIIGYERDAREKLIKDAPLEISDKICRACGIIYSARLLGFAELLNLTSAIRFGIECGAHKSHTAEDINKIILQCMPAHLQLYVDGKDEPYAELDAARADVARELFGSAKKKTVKKKSKAV
jgi:protein arginine kinase